MKIIYVSTILILSNLFAFSQQKTLNYISNSYLTSTNHLNSLTSVADYRKQVSLFSEVTFRISEYNAIYKFGYKPTTASQSIPALINISILTKSDIVQTFEEDFDRFFTLVLIDEDENNFNREIVKSTGIEGGYIFRKSGDRIYILIKSTSKQPKVRAIIQVEGLKDAQKKAFAMDFILKTVYK